MDEREIRLIRQAQQGSTAAFSQLVALHDRRVLQLAYQLLSDERDAEDVYQDIFLQVFRKLSSFRFESEFSTWLYRLVVNRCINYRRWRHRRRHQTLDAIAKGQNEASPRQFPAASLDPERELLNRELGEQIQAALAALTDRQRAVFVLRHFHGHKLQEISRILRCAEGTVKNYLFRATQHMQASLRAYHEDGV